MAYLSATVKRENDIGVFSVKDGVFSYESKDGESNFSGHWKHFKIKNPEHHIKLHCGKYGEVLTLNLSDVALKDKEVYEFIDHLATKNVFISPFDIKEIKSKFIELGADGAFEYYVKQEIVKRNNQIDAAFKEFKETSKFYEEKIKILEELLAS